MRKNSCRAMWLLAYLVFLSYCILFKSSFSYLQNCLQHIASGTIQPSSVNWIPFGNLRVTLQNWKNPWLMMNLLVNIWLFVPWGMFWTDALSAIRKGQYGVCWSLIGTLAAGVSLSLCYEWIQFQTGVGVLDVDDVILNGTGTMLGYVGYGMIQKKKMTSIVSRIVCYGLIQALGNLISVTVWTTLCYLFSVRRPGCVWIGMICGASVGSLLQSKRWQEQVRGIQKQVVAVGQYLLCFVSKFTQVWLLHGLVQRWIPNGGIGLMMACGLCSITFGIWYIGGNVCKNVFKNKRSTTAKV